MIKTCNICKEAKDTSHFFRMPRNKDGFLGRCKPCNVKMTKEWRSKNKRKVKAHTRKSDLKKKFGITVDEYNHLLMSQKGVCAICGNVHYKNLAVDHDHATGKIRGLLCSNCNVGIGFFQDDVVLLEKAKKYLTRGL